MGFSDFNLEQTMLDYPLDVKALADHLSLKRFGVMGWSGGGAPTMTCGYVIPDLIDLCIILAGYTSRGMRALPPSDSFSQNEMEGLNLKKGPAEIDMNWYPDSWKATISQSPEGVFFITVLKLTFESGNRDV
jgi:pimeloyl-ACP methyl ester carboxylesterase